MENTTLIRVLGIVGIVCVFAITAILIWYPGTPSEKLLAAGVIGGLITVIGGQLLNLKQSSENATAIAKTDKKVDANTTLTEQAVETVETTHKIVNNELSKWKQSVIDQSEKDRLLWEERSKSLIADALAEGQRRGRAEMETSHQGTVTEAARVASVAAETATEAARVVVDAAANAAALLKTSDPQAAGTVVVEVDALPATIHVTTPEEAKG